MYIKKNLHFKKNQEIFINNSENNTWKKGQALLPPVVKVPSKMNPWNHIGDCWMVRCPVLLKHQHRIIVVVFWIYQVPESKMGLTFIISKKVHSEQLLLQKCLHRAPSSHSEGSLVWRTNICAFKKSSRSRAKPGYKPCLLHSTDEVHLAAKIANNKTLKCRSAISCVLNHWS